MNTFTSNKITKKFILVLVLLILFNFCCPKRVQANFITEAWEDLLALPAKILYMMLKSVYKLLNNMFTSTSSDPNYDYHFKEIETSTSSGGVVGKRLIVYLTPENIIKGNFILFDANIFRDIDDDDSEKIYYDKELNGIKSGKQQLRNAIAGWYYALVNFSVVALLCVLVYVGIRMTISTISKDKAKYKMMFKDWLIAICLLVLMNYIMIGILTITSKITEAIGTTGNNVELIAESTQIISGILDTEGYTYTKDGIDYTLGDSYGYIIVLRRNTYIYIYFCLEIFKKRIYNNIFNIIRTCVVYYISNR